MSKISLTDLVNLQNETTAVNAINANNAVIEAAFDNTLSRDGTTPNTMGASLDMNSNQIINLPTPATAGSPVRLQDVQTGGTITNIPAGGTTGQVLAKSSNTDYAVAWTSESAELTAGSNIVLTGSTPTTIATSLTPTFTAPVLGTATATSVNKVAITAPATSAVLTIPDGVTLTGPATSGTAMTLGNAETVTGVKTFGAAGNVGKLTVAGTTSGSTVVNATAVASGTLTLPAATDTLVGKATTDILTNKTLDTAGAGNVFKINGTTISANTGTGSNVLATSPALVTPNLGVATATSIVFSPTTGGTIGTTTNDSASAGTVGEYIESVIAVGSAIAAGASGVAKNLTSISLTAGDWDVSGIVAVVPAAATSFTQTVASISSVTGTADFTNTRFSGWAGSATVPTATGGFANPVGPCRFNLASTTTVFLVSDLVYTSTAPTIYGTIRARRMR